MSKHTIMVAAITLLLQACTHAEMRVYTLKGALNRQKKITNPAPGIDGEPVWHFLRTTSSVGAIGVRKWNLDGKYVPLVEYEDRLFKDNITGWIHKPGKESPIVGRIIGNYQHGLDLKNGDVLIAPGPEHAVVVGWQSPSAGVINVTGVFQHAQTCCGINSQVNWYVQLSQRVGKEAKQTIVAKGSSDFGSSNQMGKFKVVDHQVKPGDWVYFIADAKADGTSTPHHGDASSLNVSIEFSGDPIEPPIFEKDVRPILARACGDCHGKDVQEAQLDLRTVSTILRGGENGRAVIPGNPTRSLLMDMIDQDQMPPREDGEKSELTPKDIATIRRWIQHGCKATEKVVDLPPHTTITDDDRAFWAFQPPKKTALPTVTAAHRVANEVDRFLLQQLEKNKLSYSKPASRETLIRRAYFALLWLPPSAQQMEAFQSDRRPDAWERVIDELLASPQYGERWGRHWLDAVGYVDNRLFDGDLGTIYPNENIWRYRDYVVRSMNRDTPYDQFVTEQLAGDELVDWRNAKSFNERTLELLTATGFYRSVEDHTSEAQYGVAKRYEVVFDTMSMLSTSIFGLTMECCRCHNHKFDPIPQRDYYRLMATIEPALSPYNWLKPQQRWVADVSPAERKGIDAHNASVDREIAKLNAQKKEAEKKKDQKLIGELDSKVKMVAATKKSYSKIQALFDVSADRPQSRVLRRGLPSAPGVLVEPGFLRVLSPKKAELNAVKADSVATSTTGMRLALAKWLTGKQHPLTARVMVNRVWHHHFGRGIVDTPGNFGRSGSRPTHPKLLDWLAVEFIASGWSIKRLHRTIMLSTAYRQSSAKVESSGQQSRAMQLDPTNRLLWRMPLKRLESEIIRDSILAVSNGLDLRLEGPPTMISKPSSGLSREEAQGARRRSLYLFARRVYPLKFLEVFDSPIVPINCTKRMQSATVLQSFTQLNDTFVLDQAAKIAARLLARSQDLQVRSAWRTILSRNPRKSELRMGVGFLKEQTKQYAEQKATAGSAEELALKDLCHMLLCANEFIYVE